MVQGFQALAGRGWKLLLGAENQLQLKFHTGADKRKNILEGGG